MSQTTGEVGQSALAPACGCGQPACPATCEVGAVRDRFDVGMLAEIDADDDWFTRLIHIELLDVYGPENDPPPRPSTTARQPTRFPRPR